MGFDACRGAGGPLALELAWSLGLGLEERDDSGDTCLLAAARSGEGDLMRLLARSGADLEAEDVHGMRPMHVAAASGFVEGLEILLFRGADIEARAGGSRVGATPLMMAAAAGGRPAFWLLLERGARAEVFDERGSSALESVVFARDEEAARALVELGADLTKPSSQGFAQGFVWDVAERMGMADLADFMRRREAAEREAVEIGGSAKPGAAAAPRRAL